MKGRLGGTTGQETVFTENERDRMRERESKRERPRDGDKDIPTIEKKGPVHTQKKYEDGGTQRHTQVESVMQRTRHTQRGAKVARDTQRQKGQRGSLRANPRTQRGGVGGDAGVVWSDMDTEMD